MASEWYRRACRRAVVDQHITHDDPRFLSRFDAEAYVDMLRLSGAQSAVVYAHSHVGLCFYPSTVGHVHLAARGRDLFGEVVDRAHAAGIAVVAYLSVIYDTAAYRAHPDWRIVDVNGKEVAAESRYGVCCPNAPYREYIRALGAEVAAQYPVEGVRFDMTFWPAVCYCAHCRARFQAETSQPLPVVVDWQDPHWVAFQRAREAWLCDFAGFLTQAVRAARPAASVEHQSSVYLANWRLGVTCDLAAHSDFLQGDFYGDALQGSIARKLFHNLSPNRPAAFETSVSVDLANYTVLKPEPLLRAKAAAALADGCAFVFIDSIDPVGTLNRAAYERMARVFAAVRPYQEAVADGLALGALAQDVGVYLGTEAKVDFSDNGKRIDGPGPWSGSSPHLEALVSVCRALQHSHVPFGVITRRDLHRLDRHQLVVLPNVLTMTAEEAEALRQYVYRGGRLYASGWTSLVTSAGVRQADFLLADVFGVSWAGQTAERYTYVAPAPGSEALFEGYDALHPPALDVPLMVVRAAPGAAVLATVTLPYTDPADPHRFASIHNNPPGRPTDHPAVVRHRFGAGEALYVAGDLERLDPHREIFLAMVRSLAGSFTFAAEAPAAVEVIAMRARPQGRTLISLVNFQKDLPNIPVHDIRVSVRLDDARPKRLRLLPEGSDWPCTVSGQRLHFTAPVLETLLMFALEG
jgi:hypothetical protein